MLFRILFYNILLGYLIFKAGWPFLDKKYLKWMMHKGKGISLTNNDIDDLTNNVD